MQLQRIIKSLAQLGCTAVLAAGASTAMAQQFKVAVAQIVEHPALDACREGILAGLSAAGYRQGSNLEFIFQTAQGKPDIAAQIARQFIGEQPDVLVGIATPTAQALAAATDTIPIVFSAVTDPVGAKLIQSMAAPGGNVTGISDLSPVAQHIATMQEIIPGLRTIGVVYNPGEDNSVSLVTLLKQSAQAAGIEIVEGTATRTSEIGSAAQSIAGRIDIFYAITDNTLASAISSLVSAANDAKVPIFSAETSYVDAGAVAAVGFDYYQIGYQTADYIVQILKGKQPRDLPARVAVGTDVVINPAAATRLGITLPRSLTEAAIRTVQ